MPKRVMPSTWVARGCVLHGQVQRGGEGEQEGAEIGPPLEIGERGACGWGGGKQGDTGGQVGCHQRELPSACNTEFCLRAVEQQRLQPCWRSCTKVRSPSGRHGGRGTAYSA
eukprot:350208-Chlamydomonas_euryale.AAC.16